MKYLLLILLCLSCGDDNFKKVERLESFRILGVQASLPEVAPGDTVTLKVLASDVNGTAGTITGSYEACIDPGIGRGAKVSCSHDPAKVSGTHDFVIGALTNRTGFNTAAPLSITVPGTIFTSRSSNEQFNGVGYIVIFTFIADGVEQRALKRIIATTRTGADLNVNPSGSTLLLNRGAIDLPSEGDELSVTTSAPQVYDVIKVDGGVETRTESFEVAWYTSSGEFDKPKALADESVEFKGEVQPSFVMALIRDERGGIDFVKYPL